jgi:hypothetical protein
MDWGAVLDGLTAEIAAILEDAAPLATVASMNPEQVDSLRQAGRDVGTLAAAIEVISRRAAGSDRSAASY